jgi:aminoglycoside phosphotransferase (APT) family kinase protein
MSIAQYVWAVARGLQTQVYPTTPAGAARDSLDHSIRILTAVANALEPNAVSWVERPASARTPVGRADTDRLPGPAENSAAFGDTGESIAAAAHILDSASSGSGADVLMQSDMRAHIKWEKALLDAAIARMDEVTAAQPVKLDDPRLQIDQSALQAFLRGNLSSANLTVSEFRQVLGGRSRQTALFRVLDAPGVPEYLVVQRQLPGMVPGPAFASVAAQYQVLMALHAAHLKVPRPLCYELGSRDLGSPFLVVERSRGDIVEPDYWATPKSERIALQLAEQMGRLHAQPIGNLAAVLPHSRQRSDRQGWLEELDRIASDWGTLAHWPSVTASAALEWLRANIDCVEDRQSLVHNDMVFHNILSQGDQLTAILDWEQVGVGHPAEDLGYCYPPVSGVLDWDRFLRAYHAAGGPAISRRQVDYFALRAIMRLMILVIKGGRVTFETGLSGDVLIASAGAFFSQRLLHRLARVLDAVLDRDRT